MNGDSLELMQAISDSRAETLKAIGTLHSEFSSFKGTAEEKLKNLEETDKRQWIASVCIVPIVTTLHYFANKIGIKV